MRTRSAPLVSVVIPTHNRAELVVRAVESVLRQTYGNLECLVVDDGSSDDTGQRLASLSRRDDRLRVLRHDTNRGASAARNTGLRAARGEFVAFLDDDDVWLPEKLQKQVELLVEAPSSVGLVYCWMDFYRGDEKIGTRRPLLRGRIFEHLILSQPLGGCPTLLVRKEVADRVGGFDEDLPRGNDGDFIRRIGELYEIEVLPEVLVRVDVGHAGHPRITSRSRAGMLESAEGHEAKLQKFNRFLRTRPDLRAALLAKIARQYAGAGRIWKACRRFWAAWRERPFDLRIMRECLLAVVAFATPRADGRSRGEREE